MGHLWTDAYKFKTWLDVEIAVCEAQAELGKIPADALATLPALWREGDGMLALVPHLAYDAVGSEFSEPMYFAPLAGPVTECHPSGDFHGPRAFSWGAPTPCSPNAGTRAGEGECDT